MEQYPVQQGWLPNINSFLGKNDIHSGRLHVPQESYHKFLSEYMQAIRDGALLFLSEKYHTQPFRYFAELDFEWLLEQSVVEEVAPKVIAIMTAAVQSFYRTGLPPEALVSMRTPYRVHLNLPTVITTEPMACLCRAEVISRCREELGEQPHLDWERVIDFPHGSLRMLGSLKAKHMDVDPPWVGDKAYYPVVWDEESGAWRPTGIYHRLLMQSSIFPSPEQLRDFEASDLFLEMMYVDMSEHRRRQDERRQRRQDARAGANIASGGDGSPRGPPPKKGPVRVRLTVMDDGRVRLSMQLRKWASQRRKAPKSLEP